MATAHPITTHACSEGSPALSLALTSADGTRLYASHFPAARPRAGLLLVHGLQSHARWFEASVTARNLAAAGISSLAFDRRGSGRSGGETGHAESADDFLADFAAGASALRAELDRRGGREAPLHVLANCFGTRVALPYLAEHPGVFRSVILTAPATHMSRHASYGVGQKLAILLARRHTYFPTPLCDEDFVRNGPGLDWIRRDALSLRNTTAGFLRSANRLTRRMEQAIPRLRLPLLVVLSRRDVLVDNARIREEFFRPYAGPKTLVEYDTDHYVDFSRARPELEHRIASFVLGERA